MTTNETINLDNYTVEGRLVLRTCDENMCSDGGNFQWPQPGEIVEAPDWKPTEECGNGLHGLLEGNGDGYLCNWNNSAHWLVVDTLDSEIIDLAGKVKFRKCRVLFAGKLEDAIKVLRRLGVSGTIVGDTIEDKDYKMVTVGDYGAATAGNDGTATAGRNGKAIAGHCGRAIAGNYGTASAKHCGIATAANYGAATVGNDGKATAGYHGIATAGDYGTAIVDYGGTAKVGNNGIAIAGNGGTATAGNYGTAIVGRNGTAKTGENGIIIMAYYDTQGRKQWVTGYVGENGIQPNVLYRADNTGKLIPVD